MRPQDLFGASPKTVLNKPFMHVQDQKAYNVDGGTSIADAWTKRDLNTVITNDIQGATLSGNAVNLPAGAYYVEASCKVGLASSNSGVIGIYKDGAKVLQGPTIFNAMTATATLDGNASGVVTLATPGVIDVRYFVGITLATYGQGASNNAGSITDPSIPSIYADLKIWQLDRSLEIAPKAVNGPLTSIPNVQPASPISGLDITTSGQVITVTPGACLDSTEEVAMAITVNKTWTVPSTANLETYLFLVRLVADGSFDVKGYSTLAGPSSDALVDAWRFISWGKNNGSGVLMSYVQVGSRIDWLTSSRPLVTATLTTSYVGYSLSAVVPVSICDSVGLLGDPASAQHVSLSYDGAIACTGTNTTNASGALLFVLPVNSIFIKTASATAAVNIASITLRR